MKEKNTNNLKAALRALPTYTPDSSVWTGIEQELYRKEEQEKLQLAIQELPEHTPPASLWSKIAKALPSAESSVNVRYIGRRTLTRAAAIAVLLVGSYWVLSSLVFGSREMVTFTLAAEPYEMDQVIIDDAGDDSDERMIQEALTLFSKSLNARQGGNYDLLISEWEELNTARTELQEIIEVYGDDPELIRELKDIELARSEIIRKMARWI